MSESFPSLLAGAPRHQRECWARWVLGSHSNQFLPEMVAHVESVDRLDPIAHGQPVVSAGAHREDLLVVATAQGRHSLILDVPLNCRVVLFDWTGEGIPAAANPYGFEVLSVATECKGHLIEEASRALALPPEGCYVGFVDDDVLLRFSDINTMLAMARIHQLAALQPSVSFSGSLCDEYSWLRQRACLSLHRVPIVEIMSPFIRSDLFACSLPFLTGIRSGYGLDRFALPLCADHLGCWRFAAIDLAPMSHVRPLSSVNRRFTSGLQSKDEELLVRQRLMLAMGFAVDREVYSRLEAAVASGAVQC